jgi:hypothetical protein
MYTKIDGSIDHQRAVELWYIAQGEINGGGASLL